jgi:hypothetical protein
MHWFGQRHEKRLLPNQSKGRAGNMETKCRPQGTVDLWVTLSSALISEGARYSGVDDRYHWNASVDEQADPMPDRNDEAKRPFSIQRRSALPSSGTGPSSCFKPLTPDFVSFGWAPGEMVPVATRLVG